MRHLMSPLDFSVEEVDKLLDLGNDIEKNLDAIPGSCLAGHLHGSAGYGGRGSGNRKYNSGWKSIGFGREAFNFL